MMMMAATNQHEGTSNASGASDQHRLNPGKPPAEWTPEEQALLEELFSKYSSHTVIVCYAKIAVQFKDKTVRDVAVRCRSLSEKVKYSLPKSSHVTNRSSGPSLAPPVLSKDSDDGISYKAIGGATGQLLEKNAQTLDKISANLSSHKLHENIDLLSQARDNLLILLNELNDDMPDIMKQMPALPVKLNEELANSILHPPTVQKKKK